MRDIIQFFELYYILFVESLDLQIDVMQEWMLIFRAVFEEKKCNLIH